MLNPLTTTLKPQSSGPLYSNTVISTLAVDWWAVTLIMVQRGGCGPAQSPPLCLLVITFVEKNGYNYIIMKFIK